MSVRPLQIALMGAAVILSINAPVPTFAQSEKTERDVHDLYKQCVGAQGSLDKVFCLEFVSGVARQVFTNDLALKRTDFSACPKSFVSNDKMVEAFRAWANRHLENWSASAQTGVMKAMHDTWPCS
jgi:Rap1a immunity proteins